MSGIPKLFSGLNFLFGLLTGDICKADSDGSVLSVLILSGDACSSSLLGVTSVLALPLIGDLSPAYSFGSLNNLAPLVVKI